MIRDFEHYLKGNMVKRSVINPSMAKSLMQKAELRLNRLNESEIKDELSSIMFEEAYEALREASQALMQMKGFKPYSHEALIAFLVKEKLVAKGSINSLDRYRLLRNKSVYEAHKVSAETFKEALEFAKTYLPEVRKKLVELENPPTSP